ncbi:hypothetical protein M413DRAFT_446874 [Hebeloma cylindrosporum]|uniref:LysM domain-containing protein n=1 Tax=Hebeloma cylindrosporum TaxID=76867 RepID=A0A0C3BTG8_HEBCY|nr:hypothetical protein M413DRAFT_446874 [Hebeloma cylindrosporum h7]
MSSMDRNTTLCLACASSLPPLKVSASNSIHITSCCQRPICPSCITANPRLARYNPCLACLGGVGVVASKSSFVTPPVSGAKSPGLPLNLNPNLNVDGAVRDEDTFVLGDDDDDDYSDKDDTVEEQQIADSTAAVSRSILPPPPYDATSKVPLLDSSGIHTPESEPQQDVEEAPVSSHLKSHPHPTGNISNEPVLSPSLAEHTQETRTVPYKYYINRNDTLQGLGLRFGLDAHEICKLNNLPLHAVRTMPHLLHTRAFLLLPPSTKPHPLLKQGILDEESKGDIVRKRAEKRLQVLTKEVDWRIAKAYVALAEDDHDREDREGLDTRKEKVLEKPVGAASSGDAAEMLETRAIDSYLDDENWEEAERRAGRGVFLPKFPLSSSGCQARGASWPRNMPVPGLNGDGKRWWQ